MFKAIMNNRVETYSDSELFFDDTMIDSLYELSVDIDDKLEAISNCKKLINYFNNHRLDSASLQVLCDFNDSIKYLNIELPSVESLNTNVYATDQFKTELSNKLEIAYEAFIDWWNNFLKMLRRIWDYFINKYKYYQESIENLGKELDNADPLQFNKEKGDRKIIEIYNPGFVNKVIFEIQSLFNRRFASNISTKEPEVILIDINNRNIKSKKSSDYNVGGLRYKRLSKTLQVFKESKKGKEEYTVTDVYEKFYKEGTKSQIYKNVFKLKDLMEMLSKNKSSLEAAINNQKTFDKRENKEKDMKDRVIAMLKNEYETLSYVSNCLLTMMQNYVASAKSCLSCIKKQ